MFRVVLDTVVLVRGLINPYGVWGRLVFDRAGEYRLVISPPLLAEYLEVTARPELTRKFKSLPHHMRDLLDLLSQAEIVTLGALPEFKRDPSDAHVLATVAQGGVDYLISADNDLLDLGEYEGIPVLAAPAFLRILEQGQPEE
jgi:putative PIN family toxin of toxin-antitoxin system